MLLVLREGGGEEVLEGGDGASDFALSLARGALKSFFADRVPIEASTVEAPQLKMTDVVRMSRTDTEDVAELSRSETGFRVRARIRALAPHAPARA